VFPGLLCFNDNLYKSPNSEEFALLEFEFEFDRDIAIEDNGAGVFAANLAAVWVVGGGVNGGYLLFR
jgi:hypothetical protein